MQNVTIRVAATTLVIAGFGVAAQAAPSFHSPLRKAVSAVQSQAVKDNSSYEWALPSVIQSGLIERGISFFVGDNYSSFEGRSFELKQEQLKLGITDQIEIFYGRQFTLAQGRTSPSRFYDDDDYYGARAVIKRPTDADPSAWALQFEALRPGTAQISTAGGGE